MAPIIEDKVGEEMEKCKAGDVTPTPYSPRSRRSSVAPIVVRNRLHQRLNRKDLYFKAIQELLEIGDAYRVIKNAMSTISEDSDDDTDSMDDLDDQCHETFPFEHKLKARKMSCSGIFTCAKRAS